MTPSRAVANTLLCVSNKTFLDDLDFPFVKKSNSLSLGSISFR